MTGALSGKIAVVTGASRGIGRAIAALLADAGAQVAGAGCQRHQPFQRSHHVGIRETEVAMPPLALHGDKSGPLQLGQMAADRRQPETRFLGQLGHSKRGPGQQRGQHIGAGRIADQRGDTGNVRTFLHSLVFTELCSRVNVQL